MEEHNNSYLATQKVGKLMSKYAVPCIISLLVGALYNIVDQIFIANASYLGSYGNAANTVVFPLTVIALGIAVMIGDGGHQQYDSQVRRHGCGIRSGAVCADTNGCRRHCYEIFSDSYIGCHRYGGACGRQLTAERACSFSHFSASKIHRG